MDAPQMTQSEERVCCEQLGRLWNKGHSEPRKHMQLREGEGGAVRAGVGQAPVHSNKGKAHADGFLVLERELANCILVFLLKISLLF